MFSLSKLRAQLDQTQQALVIAYSGGLDSHVLLHSLVQLGIQPLRAVHINHRLHPDATAWTEHCQHICDELNIPLQCITVTIDTTNGNSTEAAARDARYRALFNTLAENECLLTAHHKTDQAETILLQLLRGAGLKGLSGINNYCSNKKLLRPLLSFSRDELKNYATTNQLQWLDDPSNTDSRFDRNYLRHKVMPLLEARWPGALSTLSRSAALCAEADTLLTELATLDRATTLASQNKLPIANLLALPRARQKNLLRYWLMLNNLPLPSEKKTNCILDNVVYAAPDTTPHVHWPGAEIRRYKNELYTQLIAITKDKTLLTQSNALSDLRLPWDFRAPLQLPVAAGGGQLVAIFNEACAAPLIANDIQLYTIRFRRGGERCRLKGHAHSHTLKKLMQDWHIPPWLRHKIPLLYRNDTLIAIVGYCYCEEFDLPMKLEKSQN